MGNQLSAVAPGQIFPVENFLTEYNYNRNLKELEFEKSLGSTRFLKVVKCLSDEGPVVVKVFVINDPQLPIAEHRKKIKDLSSKLTTSMNCLPFHRTERTERAAFIIRPFIKTSLYDRISTRPFLTPIEKKWLAFQLLNGLKYCHGQQFCHGDIKLENLMVSSWSWLMLSDFATFKPVLLPEDNPTDFTYYFDTSRRRVCYIAPERFVKILQREEDQVLKEVKDKGTELTPAMDMFSTGCVLAELFTEGMFPFNLMQLFQYRSDTYYPDNVLNEIADERIKNMVRQMIQKDPLQRRSAEYYLESERGKTFPEHFYTFLWPFCQQFAQNAGFPPDERITRIEESFDDILSAFGVTTTSTTADADDENEDKTKHTTDDSLIPIITLITSCIRSLHYSSSKMCALGCLLKLCLHVSDEIILDRIVPYILNLLKDPEPKVRAEAVFTLTRCLSVVTSVPRSEINIFSEYIFPHLHEVTSDESVIVRQVEAANMATIADTALRFVEYCLIQGLLLSPETEIETLQEIVQQKLARLFSDSSNIVKRTLIEETMNTLCLFFGRDKAYDVLLSHLITFLNEKRDCQLRLSFFKNITGIAAFMGNYCSPIFKPLLLQGLSDSEELVTVEVLDTMSTLTEIGIFPGHTLWNLIKETVPLLIHPNSWIRKAVVGFIVTASKALPFLDVMTIVSDTMKPFVTKNIVQFDKEECVLSGLKNSFSRDAYDTLIKSPDVHHILHILEESSSQSVPLEELPQLNTVDQPTRNILRRLIGAGLTEEYINLLSYLKKHLGNVHKYKRTFDPAGGKPPESQPGTINIEEEMRIEPFFTNHRRLMSTEASLEISSLPLSSQNVPKSSSLTMNEEWRTMFGNTSPENSVEAKSPSTVMKTASSNSTPLSQSFMLDQSQMEKSNMSKCLNRCHNDFQELMVLKTDEAIVAARSKKASSTSNCETFSLPHKWKPKGYLVSHLQEHKDAITRLVAFKGTTLLASSSKDGTVKIWDSNRTERNFPINRSKYTYAHQKGIINCVTYCSMQESFASASDNSSIHVVKVDKQALLASRQLSPEKDGYALDMHYMDAGSQSMLTYSTVYGDIVGWDLRSPNNAWVLKNGVKKGVITSYAISPSNNWLACGTSSGYVIGWDLRFMLKISQMRHPYEQGVERLQIHPTKPSWVISSMRSNNEVIFWDIESQSRMRTLWASSSPPFGSKTSRNKSANENWISGFIAAQTESGGVFALTCGTDSRIRHWDIDSPDYSSVISHPASYNGHSYFSYASKVIDGSEVLIETVTPKPSDQEPSDGSPQRVPDQPATGHRNTITDMILVHRPQNLLITSGYDGTIKMWK